ncbi:hypothetical protein GALMADRAFT_159495 [Galerina marginata CBS 339.88]|uniref:DUF6534 domain-containing protein n=1 Tax=Galerina marginata (strain CBS 339.88) TaxID=685588 RepID=A0A067SWX6_GALM3|nr:hypothetical protein GALMADRAFT_159495 [Galerina marginata CBS 339.88]
MTSITLTPTELGRITGPQFLGNLLNWGFLGVLSMQIYMYYLAFPNDRVSTKALVYMVYLLAVAHTFLLTASAFRTYVSEFGDFAALDEVDMTWGSDIPTGLITFLAQAFYAYRIAVLSQKRYLSVLIMLLAFLSLAGCITAGVEAKIAVLYSRLVTKRTLITSGIWGGGSAACDVLIAASMTYYLKRRDPGFGQTHVLLTRIIRLTIETGSATAAVAILSVILVFLPGHPNYYLTSVIVAGKMYAISMMASLNSRMKIGLSNNTIVATSCEFRSAFKFNLPTTLPDVDVESSRSADGRIQKTGDEVFLSFPQMGEISQED